MTVFVNIRMNTGWFHRISSSDSTYSLQKAFSRQGRLLHIKGCIEWPFSHNAYFRGAFSIRGVYWGIGVQRSFSVYRKDYQAFKVIDCN